MNRRDRSDLGQGRDDAQKLAAEKGARIIFKLIGLALLVLAAAGAVLLLAGCVQAGPTREAMVCGERVTYHPDDLKPCNGGASACTLKPASAAAFNVYYSTMDETVLAHEEEHICGMRHREPWVTVAGKICTVVTEGGSTSWKKGDVMCRIDAGPPVKIADDRIRKYTLEAR